MSKTETGGNEETSRFSLYNYKERKGTDMDTPKEEKIIAEFARKLSEDAKEIPEEIQEVINDNFFEML